MRKGAKWAGRQKGGAARGQASRRETKLHPPSGPASAAAAASATTR
eukprot:SAG25_NODE_3240_length_1162_cov_1.283161_1_plen_45_part_10